jgi:hypothetical protein
MRYFLFDAYLYFNAIYVVLILLCLSSQRGEKHGANYVPSSNIFLQYDHAVEDTNAYY